MVVRHWNLCRRETGRLIETVNRGDLLIEGRSRLLCRTALDFKACLTTRDRPADIAVGLSNVAARYGRAVSAATGTRPPSICAGRIGDGAWRGAGRPAETVRPAKRMFVSQ
ncbi:hypothetical protein MRA01_50810 [Methylobacterium radiotolerans]|nr:hypothetical protein MRA01_50810 [Methylobacterium radiotolerans]